MDNNNVPESDKTKIIVGVGLLLLVVAAILVYFFVIKKKPKVDCKMGDLGSFAACSPQDNCPSGMNEFAVRSIKTQPKNGGKKCSEDLREYRNNCVMSAWSGWRPCEPGECSGNNNQIKTRSVVSGTCEPSSFPRSEEKYVQPECIMSEWSGWRTCMFDECSGNNNQMRTRSILSGTCDLTTYPLTEERYVEPVCSSWTKCGSEYCPAGRNEYLDCDGVRTYRYVTPVNCTVSPWSAWAPCSSGGSGVCGPSDTHYRHRIIATEENQHGVCPERSQLNQSVELPGWATGKMCGDPTNTSAACVMPYGYPCESSKNIAYSGDGSNCKNAVASLGKPTGFFSGAGDLPSYCSYNEKLYPARVGFINNGNYNHKFNKDTGYVAICNK